MRADGAFAGRQEEGLIQGSLNADSYRMHPVETLANLDQVSSDAEVAEQIVASLVQAAELSFCRVTLGGARAARGQPGPGALQNRQLGPAEIEFKGTSNAFLDSVFKLLRVALEHREGRRDGHWSWLETMDRVHRAIQSSLSLEDLLEKVLGCLLAGQIRSEWLSRSA